MNEKVKQIRDQDIVPVLENALNYGTPWDTLYLASLEEIFNQEIVRESLREINPDVDDALVERIWTLCEGNPWNAVPLYKILKTVGKV